LCIEEGTMPQITIVGLGPGAPNDLTREAWQTLMEAEELWLRTAHHPVVADLPAHLILHAFDSVYERADHFKDVYAEISARVVALGRRSEGVVYAVPGHPLVGEATVTQILAAAEVEGLMVRIVNGLSFIEPALTALRLDGLDGLQVCDALDVISLHHPPLNPDFPALIAQVYSRAVASELKLVLMNQYPDAHPTALLDSAGTPREQVKHLPLYEIDRYEATPLTSLYLAPLPHVSSFEGFQETIARLRSPEGCPWDREQTHQSLRTNLLEETYEVLEAIDADDVEALKEELGDLLLQVVLHAQIAVEDGYFQMTEVIAQIDAKLKRRHPHVWAPSSEERRVEVDGVSDVVTNWEAIKQSERADKGTPERSLLDGIPAALPALTQAAAYTDRAARVGFDRLQAGNGLPFDNGLPFANGLPFGVGASLGRAEAERLNRFLAALGTAMEGGADDEMGSQWLGDALLVIADWSRRHHIDPESALREANARFARRFAGVESASRVEGIPLESMSPDEIRRLWLKSGTS
jgi:tetrapyrrole methylase family protein / MazG family protein